MPQQTPRSSTRRPRSRLTKVLLVGVANWRFLATRDAKGRQTFSTNMGRATQQIAELEKAGLPANLATQLAAEKSYVETHVSAFEQASADLDAAVKRHGFGVLHVHDLGATLRSKGIAFDNECRVFEVCNPGQAAKVLASDMRLNMALPCRISVFTEKGRTHIGMIKPVQILAALSDDAALAQVAREVEDKTIRMIDEAK